MPKAFAVCGPEQKLHSRSQNLGVFLQLADGVDDETWLYHLRLGDYSRWVRDAIKDDALADEIAPVESAEMCRPGIAALPSQRPSVGAIHTLARRTAESSTRFELHT